MALTREQVEVIVTIGEKTGYEDLVEVARDWLQKDEQIRRMREALEALDRRGGLGAEWHYMIRKALADIDAGSVNGTVRDKGYQQHTLTVEAFGDSDDVNWTLPEIVVQLESCNFECIAGPLRNNVAFIALKELAEGSGADAEEESD